MVFHKKDMVKPPCGEEYPDADWLYSREYYCSRPEKHNGSHRTTIDGKHVYWN